MEKRTLTLDFLNSVYSDSGRSVLADLQEYNQSIYDRLVCKYGVAKNPS